MNSTRVTLINSAALAISSGLNFVALFLWVRLLDPHAFGTYSIVSATALLLNALLFEWLRLVGARTLYDSNAPLLIDAGRADSLFTLSVAVIALFVGTALILWSARVALFGFDPKWLPLIVAFVLSEMALAILAMVSRVRMFAWQFFHATVFRSALSIVLGLVLVMAFGLGATGVLTGMVAAQLLTAAALMLRDPFWRGLRPGSAGHASREGIREILTLGYPLIASAALSYGVGIADRYLVNGVLGTAQVGYYSAPVDVLQKTLGFIMLTINISAYPALIRAFEDHGQAAACKILENNFVTQLGLGLPVAVAFGVLAPGFANLMLGPTYKSIGAILFPWVAAAALLRLLVNFHLLMVFQLARRMKLMLVAPLVTLAVLVPASIGGMQLFGLLGMAMAAMAAQLVAYGICVIIARRIFPFRVITPDIVKVVIASVAMGVCLVPFARYTHPVAVIAICAGGGVVYLGALISLRLERARPVFDRAVCMLKRG